MTLPAPAPAESSPLAVILRPLPAAQPQSSPPQPLLPPASGWLGVAWPGGRPSLRRVGGGYFLAVRGPNSPLLLAAASPPLRASPVFF